MAGKSPCSTCFAAVFVTVIMVSSPPLAGAQTDFLRPNVELTRRPTLATEVWPADFNEDGITDLIAGAPAPRNDLVVLLGIGDGTFAPEQVIAAGLRSPVGVGDLNNDGFIDVLAVAVVGSTTPGYILAGRGNGSFAAPVATSIPLAAPTQVLDMNADGRADLVISGPDRVRIYPGNGDFTFGAGTELPTAIMKQSQIAVDLNGDSLPDIATIGRFRTIHLFLNQGNLAFRHSSIALDLPGLGITARDLNGDGLVDLVASTGEYGLQGSAWVSGFVHVLLGNGDGTFQSPRTFPTNSGPLHAVVGDFTGDGIPDVATGNASTVFRCDTINLLWSSISILRGTGDGTFGPAASFALGNSNAQSQYKTVTRLNTSDLNADGRTDLIASPGAILLARPPVDNQPPIADAGPDRVAPFDSTHLLTGSAIDPDNDWLTFEWRDDYGNIVGDIPNTCVRQRYYGTRTFTMTVTDGRGGISTDSMQWTFSDSEPVTLPEGWEAGNIGTVAASGHESFSGGTYRVSGSGADIWGTEDAFRFVRTAVSGNFEVVTRVTGVENIHQWTKAGLMIRQSLSPGSRHASIFATPTAVKGVAFQRREVDSGFSIHTPGPSVAPPVWLRLTREGDVITAYARTTTTEEWIEIGVQTLAGLSDPVFVGMAVTSHLDGTAATAFFSDFAIATMSAESPTGWSGADVGSVGASGSTLLDGPTITITGSGADIWDTQDAFHYAYQRWTADGVLTGRVADIAGPHHWSKAGLMIRASLAPDAAHHYLLLSEARGLAYQRRETAGEYSRHTALSTDAMPVWYRIERSGGTITLSYSLEPATPANWQVVAQSPFPTGEVLVGLAVTSHSDGQLATGTFDNVSISESD